MAIETIQLGKILITHKGAWSSAVAYEALDVVSYIGSSYLALTAPPMGTLVTNATYWRPLSKSAYQYAVEAGYTGTEEEFGILIDSIQDRELVSNKVTSISVASTDTEYPSAKATHTALELKVDNADIVNTLTEATAGKVLDARQGKALNDAKINKDGSNSAIETLTFIGVTDADVPIELPVEYSKDDGTYNFTLPSGAVGQLFQELYFHAKTTEAITEGDAIQYAGAQGRHALIKKAVPAEIKVNPYLFMGIATTSAANNAFCKVTWFGNVSGVSTTGWSLGNILYYDSTNVSAGKLTNTMPVAPNTRINVGVVTLLSTGGAANGTILVRPEFHNKLVDADDVYTPTLANGDVLKWNNTTKRFEVFNIDTALGLKSDKTALEATEEVAAQSLVELKERIDALEELIKQGILNNIIIKRLSVEDLQLNGASLILTGADAPAVTPDFIGQFYIKTTATTACYQSTGTTAVGDWKLIG